MYTSNKQENMLRPVRYICKRLDDSSMVELQSDTIYSVSEITAYTYTLNCKY